MGSPMQFLSALTIFENGYRRPATTADSNCLPQRIICSSIFANCSQPNSPPAGAFSNGEKRDCENPFQQKPPMSGLG